MSSMKEAFDCVCTLIQELDYGLGVCLSPSGKDIDIEELAHFF